MKHRSKNSIDQGQTLWRARRRAGLERKQVAYLMGHRTPDTIARYERGEIEPNLDNAIKLALVYGIRIDRLFPRKYQAFRAGIVPRLKGAYLPRPAADDLFLSLGRCSYEDVLNEPAAAEYHAASVRSHITALAKKLAGL